MEQATDVAVNRPLPVPDDFPVVWEHPADEARFWTRDRMHAPDPVTPLVYSIAEEAVQPAFSETFQAFGLPADGFVSRRINGYLYMRTPDLAAPPPGPAPDLEARARAAMAGVGQAWRDEYLPEILEHLAAWDAYDLAAAEWPELLDHLAETLNRYRRLWVLHNLSVFPAYMALSALEDCYRELLGGDAPFDAWRLVQGYPNKTTEIGHALWRLRDLARAQPEVAAALAGPAAGVRERLAASVSGKDFLGALDGFLDAYGARGATWFSMAEPAWIEDPTPVLDSLRGYLAQPDDADPARVQARLAAERDEAVAEVRTRLAGHPEPDRQRFEFLLRAAQEGVSVTEDHGFYIDFGATYRVRRVLVELGRRLAGGGCFDDPGDVFFLTLAELRQVTATRPHPDRRDLVARQRAELERFAAVEPPEALGTPPPHRPLPDNPFVRTMAKFSGHQLGAPPPDAAPEPSDDGVLRGHPGSPGKMTGVARVIRSLDDADRLGPGEVLVTVATAPPWTPLFAVAGGLVIDIGGILSHAAVVAREYGLPAVIGTGRGSVRIPDGALVEVDGDTGVVRLLH